MVSMFTIIIITNSELNFPCDRDCSFHLQPLSAAHHEYLLRFTSSIHMILTSAAIFIRLLNESSKPKRKTKLAILQLTLPRLKCKEKWIQSVSVYSAVTMFILAFYPRMATLGLSFSFLPFFFLFWKYQRQKKWAVNQTGPHAPILVFYRFVS